MVGGGGGGKGEWKAFMVRIQERGATFSQSKPRWEKRREWGPGMVRWRRGAKGEGEGGGSVMPRGGEGRGGGPVPQGRSRSGGVRAGDRQSEREVLPGGPQPQCRVARRG
jgi:hypothetical protein